MKHFYQLPLLAVCAFSCHAQMVVCTTNSGVPPVVRMEGTAELVGDYVITCTGGTAGQQLTLDLSLFLNTNITNTTDGELTDVLLLVNEPVAPVQPGVNAFRANRVTANSVRFPALPVPVPGPNAILTLRITNVRADALGLGAGTPVLPPQILAFVSVASSGIAIDNPHQVVAYSMPAVEVQLRSASDGAFTPLLIDMATGLNAALLDGSGAGATPQYLIQFREGFQTAFRTRSIASDPALAPPPQNIPGEVYDSETRYYDPQLTSSLKWNTVGLASNGTRLMARFSDIPVGAKLYVSTTPWPVGTKENGDFNTPALGTGGAVLVSTDENGAGAYAPLPATLTTTVGGTAVGLREIIAVNRSATAVWEIRNARQSWSVNDVLSFAVFYAYRAGTIPYPSYVQGSLAPVAVTDSVSVPRFVSTTAVLPVTRTLAPYPPPAPELSAPQSNSAGVNFRDVTLTWRSAPSAMSYEVYFGTTPSPPLVGNTSQTLYRPGRIRAGTKFYWKIVAKNNAGSSTPSLTAAFTTATGPSAAPEVLDGPSGTGLTKTFTIGYSDPDGTEDIETAFLMIASSVSPAGSCFVEYNRLTNTFRLINDAGDTWSAAMPAGSATLSNAACTIGGSPGGAQSGGLRMTVDFPVTFKPNFAGEKNLYAYVTDVAGIAAAGGWKQVGTWTIPGPPPAPDVIGMAPVNSSSTTGTSGLFRAVFRHPGGPSQHYLGMMLFLPLPNVVSFNAQGTCLIEYNRLGGNFDGRGGIRLIDDAGTGWLGRKVGEPLAPSTPALRNNTCTVNVAGASASFQGNDMIVTVPVTFNPAYVTQTMGTFIQSNSTTGQWTDFRQFGNWTVPGAPVRRGPRVVSATPGSGSGSSTTLTVTAGHSAGLSQLGEVHIRVNSSIVGGTPCHVIYSPVVNVLSMINDAGTALVGPVPLGQPLTTDRCSVPAGAWRLQSGTNVTLHLPLTFDVASFGAGTKNVYVNGIDIDGAVTHWVQTGTWTVQ